MHSPCDTPCFDKPLAQQCGDCLYQTAERLQADIQYALDKLSVKADQGPGLRVLIDDATGNGDYFPAYELRRQREQFDALNKQLGETTRFIEEAVVEHGARKKEIELLREELEGERLWIKEGKKLHVGQKLIIKQLQDRLRAAAGGCRILSEGNKCDCGLCKRDKEIERLEKVVRLAGRRLSVCGEYTGIVNELLRETAEAEKGE